MVVLTRPSSSLEISDRTQEETPLLSLNSGDTSCVDGAFFFKTALCVGFLTFVSGLDVTVVATVGPAIGKEFSKESMSLFLGTTFLISSASSTLICSRSSDVYGRRLTTTAACLLYTLGSLACATVVSIPGIFMGRAIAGFGLGGLNVMISVILSGTVPLKSRALWHGIGKLIAGVAMSAGGPIGGWVSDQFTWRAVFYAQVPLGIISATAASYALHDGEAVRHQVELPSRILLPIIPDIVVYILVTISISAFYLSLSGASSALELSRTICLSLACVGLLAAIGLYFTCAFTGKPVVRLRHLRSRNITPTILITCISSMAHQSILYNIPLFATSISHASATVAGAYMTPVSVAAVLATLIAGLRISRSGKYKRMMFLGAFFTTMGPVAFASISVFPPKAPFDMILEALSSFPSTFGSQLLSAISIVVILASSEPNDIAELTSYYGLSKSLGGVVGTALTGSLLEVFLSACRVQKSQVDENLNIVTNTFIKAVTEARGEQSDADLNCLRSGFGRMFAVIAVISAVNVILLFFGVSEIPLVHE
ncbi:MFS general substrate transporter [Sanghuangporus baumii]|uniref:MFS general substrate transporter n=1 Tax=Sanghuangporus baumii TaxID=108892 RepID=A0A9Q5I116_SANBA|nr:MFS general substrate transporter [Sanghuangporus baumii]